MLVRGALPGVLPGVRKQRPYCAALAAVARTGSLGFQRTLEKARPPFVSSRLHDAGPSSSLAFASRVVSRCHLFCINENQGLGTFCNRPKAPGSKDKAAFCTMTCLQSRTHRVER